MAPFGARSQTVEVGETEAVRLQITETQHFTIRLYEDFRLLVLVGISAVVREISLMGRFIVVCALLDLSAFLLL